MNEKNVTGRQMEMPNKEEVLGISISSKRYPREKYIKINNNKSTQAGQC